MNSSLHSAPVRRRAAWARLALVPAAALVLSACGGDDEAPAQSESSVSSSPQSTSPSPSEQSSPSAEDSAPASDAPSSPESAPAAEGSSPASDPSAPGSEESAPAGDGATLDIATFQDMEGIDTKVDSLTAQEACGYLQGAMADPAALDHPAVGAPGVRDLAKVSPPQVRDAIESLAAAMSTASGPSDPALGQQLGQVDETCMASLG